jgi:FMN phosphatase YigB (HAD superfamily)
LPGQSPHSPATPRQIAPLSDTGGGDPVRVARRTTPGSIACAFDDTLPVLRELKSRGVRIVVLSNIGMNIRDWLARAGVSDVLDGVVLSYEVGLVKPDPAVFAHALTLLDVPGSQTLMVGDSPRDDVGGVALGIRTLILPPTHGPVHGLDAVLRLVGH